MYDDMTDPMFDDIRDREMFADPGGKCRRCYDAERRR